MTTSKILTSAEVAPLIGLSPFSIHSAMTRDRNRKIKRVPPHIEIPGGRRVLWREDVVLAWLDKFIVAPAPAPAKPGRPTKLAQRTRQAAQQQ